MMERLTVNSLFKDDDKIIKQMKADYYACPAAVKFIKALNIPDDVVEAQIVKINDLVKDINHCRHCPGVDKCDKETPRLVTRIAYEDGVVVRQMVPCKEYLKYINFKRQFIVRDFPDEWLTSALKKIDCTAQRAEVIKRYEEYRKNNEGQWIYLTGEEGTGRTYVAANIALDIAKNERGPIAFLDVPSRFKELASKKDNAAFTELLDKYMNVPVLVLDDLGNEYKSEFVREAILFPILNARSKNHLFTVITSDFSVNDYCLMYQNNASSKPKIEQIKKLFKKNIGEEINLGSLSIYK